MRLLPHNRRGSLWRFFAAAVLIICSTAAATAVAGLLQFKQLGADFNVSPSIAGAQVSIPQPGNPQTILVIGSDHRIGDPFTNARTDTMLLIRLNGDSQTINVMSIPRDLKVNVPSRYVPQAECASSSVPGDCAEKINAAYSEGSYGLLIRTIKRNVFPQLKITHIVDTNFGGFSDLVDAIGCIYADVDHRYFNISQGPPVGPNNYSSIDVQHCTDEIVSSDAFIQPSITEPSFAIFISAASGV